ncbi:hypothetical protein ACROYT_G043458 [Oculina patagonica]
MITADSRPGDRSLNFRKVEKHLEGAFDTKKIKPKAVCLEINSRGGSPVQSNLIYQRIRALSKKNAVPVLSFAEDTAASGGYWLALAGDEIFVDPNTVIGNIGALYGTFGMEETIKKLGLEWRLLTAGENKFRNDPFKPVKQEDVDFLQNILNQIHVNFINKVKERRPTLDVKHKTVFTGDYFLGTDAVSIGLADGICSDMKALCRERFGEDVKFERCEPPQGFLSGLKNFGSETRVEISMNDALEELAVKQQGF